MNLIKNDVPNPRNREANTLVLHVTSSTTQEETPVLALRSTLRRA